MTVTPTPHRGPAADPPDPLVAPTPEVEPPAGPAPPPAVAPTPRALAEDDALTFASTGGPLLVVCGLQGGAGASTLANVIAAAAAAASEQPVMLCEAAGAGGDQAALTGARSQLTLEELAATVATGQRPPRRFWAQTGRLRLLAAAPRPTPPHATGQAVADVLVTARAEHALTVVDAGDVRDPRARPILQAATHVLWVLRLEPGAVGLARERLASRLVGALAARQALAVRGARPR